MDRRDITKHTSKVSVFEKSQVEKEIEEEIKKLITQISESYAKTGESHEVDRSIWFEKINVLQAAKKCLSEEVNIEDVIRLNPRYQQKWSLTSGWYDSTNSTTEALLKKALDLIQYDYKILNIIKEIQTQINKLATDIQKYSSDKIKNKEHIDVWEDKIYVLKKEALVLANPPVDLVAVKRDHPRYNQEYSYLSGWYESSDTTTEKLIKTAEEKRSDHGKRNI
jgi:hypothetical protein